MPYKLLLADDSVTIQRVIELTFSGEDVDVLAVSDGEQAIARIPVERPDIVLADIGMPKRNGYDVAAFVKGDESLKHIPVLLLAGAFEPIDDNLAAEAGSDGVLVKPFEPQHVIARVRELLEGKKPVATRATAAVVAQPPERLLPRKEDRVLSPPLEFPRREEPPPAIDRDAVDAFDLVEIDAAPGGSLGSSQGQGADESLDEYFDRLDAAFATLSGASMSSPDPRGDAGRFDDRLDVPTLDDLLGSDFGTVPTSPIDLPLSTPTVTPFVPKSFVAPPTVEPPDTSSTRTPAPPAQRPDPGAAASDHIVADAFTALLAVEQGESGAPPVRLTAAPSAPIITDAFIDEVVRRVMERLAPDAARDVIANIVSDIAERLVREEIDRIRKR